MYISQVPEENNQDNQAKTVIRKKSKASYIVFLVNLFLMAIAFFVIKNQNEEKNNNQEDNNFGNAEALPAELTADENETVLKEENNQTEDPSLIEGNIGISVTQPTVQKNTGISATSPPTNTAVPAPKSTKKTKTS